MGAPLWESLTYYYDSIKDHENAENASRKWLEIDPGVGANIALIDQLNAQNKHDQSIEHCLELVKK